MAGTYNLHKCGKINVSLKPLSQYYFIMVALVNKYMQWCHQKSNSLLSSIFSCHFYCKTYIWIWLLATLGDRCFLIHIYWQRATFQKLLIQIICFRLYHHRFPFPHNMANENVVPNYFRSNLYKKHIYLRTIILLE